MERMSEGVAAGPSDRGAALVIGHNVKQWHDWYDLKFHSRLAQNAVNSMQDWRLALLGVAAQAPSAPRRRAQIVYTDSDSDSEPMQQPASAHQHQSAATSRQPQMAAEPTHSQQLTTASQQQQMAAEPEYIIISDSDSDIELWV